MSPYVPSAIWTVVVTVGLVVSIKALRAAVRTQAYLLKSKTHPGLEAFARQTVLREMFRVIMQSINLSLGLLSLALITFEHASPFLGIWPPTGLIIVAMILTWLSISDARLRRRMVPTITERREDTAKDVVAEAKEAAVTLKADQEASDQEASDQASSS